MIRTVSPEDSASLVAIYAPYVRETTITFEYDVPTVREFRVRIEDAQQSGYPWLLATDRTQSVLGYAYSCPHRAREGYRWSIETSVYVSAEAQRCGVGSGLYGELIERLRGAGFVNAYAGIALPNDASVAFHHRHGFEHIGTYRGVGYKLGKWCDVGWWGLRLTDSAVPPSIA